MTTYICLLKFCCLAANVLSLFVSKSLPSNGSIRHNTFLTIHKSYHIVLTSLISRLISFDDCTYFYFYYSLSVIQYPNMLYFGDTKTFIVLLQWWVHENENCHNSDSCFHRLPLLLASSIFSHKSIANQNLVFKLSVNRNIRS
jgi:hypothetical protein